MRLLIELSSSDNNPITIPIHYNHLIQSAIYGALDNDFADFLHDTGFEGGGRRFKLFTFSRLTGAYRFNSATGQRQSTTRSGRFSHSGNKSRKSAGGDG